jgi:S-adenosylmethionine uptake transporter
MPQDAGPPTPPARTLSPFLTVSIGILLLCLMDVAIKHLVLRYHVFMVLFGRCLFATLFAWILWRRAGRPAITREAAIANTVRGGVIAVSASGFFYAVKVMPLVEAIVLAFIAPLLIPFFAWALLKEAPRPSSLVAIAIGCLGAFLTVSGAPAAERGPDYLLGLAAILGSAVGYVLSITLLRQRAGKDGPEIVSLFTALIPGLIVAAPAFMWGAPPALADVPIFAAMAALLVGGMMFMTMAYARAEAQALAPMEYVALIWAAIFGFLFFREVPRAELWIGSSTIIAACLFAAWDERRSR